MSEVRKLTCEEALRALATYIDGELDRGDQEAVQHHIEHCKSCFSRAEFERRLKLQLAGIGHQHVNADLAGRIRALIRDFPLA
ncbi:MAG: zf-HC2 domain-containing protein [Gemmatimonadota bacterium]